MATRPSVTYDEVMTPTALVPVEEYLSTAYSPDCDYVDGVVEERNLGERDHSRIQKRLLLLLSQFEQTSGAEALPEQRVRLGPTRYRIPDVCVLRPDHPPEQIITHPPFICIEILSPDDRVSRMQLRLEEYLSFGVPHVWMIDPMQKRAWRYLPGQTTEVKDALRTEDPEIVIQLSELFA